MQPLPSPSGDSNPYADSLPSASAAKPRSNAPASQGTVTAVRGTRLWMYVVSVVGLLLSSLILLSLIGMLMSLAQFSGRAGFRGNIGPFLEVAVGYGIFIVGVTAASILLWRYANGIGRFQRRPDSERLEQMLALQRSFWWYSGAAFLGAAGVYVVMAVFAWAGAN